MKILIADDDPQMLRALRITLKARGYEIFTAINGADAVNAAIEHQPDIYMLDLGMPELDGLDVIHALRGWTHAPILVVSGRASSQEKIAALDAGADDYVTKPFSIDELLARIRALSRRTPNATASSHSATPVMRIADITIDLAAKSITKSHADGPVLLRLTPTEWSVLEILVRNAGRLVTRQTLLTEIWGSEHTSDSGYLRLYISQLRKKIEPDPSHPVYLLTEAGMGYRFQPEQSSSSLP